MNPYFFLLGYTVVRVGASSATDFFELCRVLEITPKKLKRVAKTEDFTCCFTSFSAAKVLAFSASRGLDVSPLKRGGIPSLWRRFIHRPGLVIGTVLALMLLCLGRLFVWEVALEGCQAVGEEEILAELGELGLKRGAFLPHLDGDDIALSLRQSDARIGYATVNLVGTVAFVQIEEALPVPDTAPTAPANLVAKKDGVVLLPMIFEGERRVEIGERVRAGQLLASGIIDGKDGGFRVTRASGQVWARTEETITVSIPFVYEEKHYTGKIYSEVEVDFFGFSGKVFKTTGNVNANCDIIVKKYNFFAGARVLPVGFSSSLYHVYEYKSTKRTAAEALALAREVLAARLVDEGEGRKLLATEVETVLDGTGVTLCCTATFEEDIGLISEFFMEAGGK